MIFHLPLQRGPNVSHPTRSKEKFGPRLSVNTKVKPRAGEVWLADLGTIAKTRPVLILSYPAANDARMLAIVAPLTSQIRNLPGEIHIGRPKWLPKESAVNVQGLASIDKNCLVRKIGALPAKDYALVKDEIRKLLQL